MGGSNLNVNRKDLQQLTRDTSRRGSGLHAQELQTNSDFKVNWLVVRDRTEGSRYVSHKSEADARDLYSAITARKNGVGRSATGLRFSRNTVNGRFVEDAYVYRTAA